MVDAVNIVGKQGAVSRVVSQEQVAPVSAARETSTRSSAQQAFVASRIRVDNVQNLVILEYRSEDGEVERQYPTKYQIKAFKEAEALQQANQKVRAQEEARVTQTSETSVIVNVASSETTSDASDEPAAPVVSTPAPVVSTPAPVVSTPAPVVSTPAPVVSTPAPVVSTPAPAFVSTESSVSITA